MPAGQRHTGRAARRALPLAAALIVASFAASEACAGTFKVLHSFCGAKDGCIPEGGLVMDQAGNFFGTTYEGGIQPGLGTAFKLERTDTGKFKEKVIFRFCKGEVCTGGLSPRGNLVIDTQGNLYGIAKTTGHNGLIYELSPPKGTKKTYTEKVLYKFCSQQNCIDGTGPVGSLTYAGQASGVPYDGVSPLFGATNGGGAHDAGTVYQLTRSGGDWTETTLYSFCSQGGDQCTDGAVPGQGVILDQLGNLYGTTSAGGGHDSGNFVGGAGTVFELSPDGNGTWHESVLHAFCSLSKCEDGAFPSSSLTLDAVGNLLGSSIGGGVHCKDSGGCGVIFKFSPAGQDWEETILYFFCAKKDCRDGAGPLAGVLLDESGNMFGTTSFGGGNDIDYFDEGGGVVYELSGSNYTVLHHFCSEANCADGEYPERDALVADGNGNLFGTTEFGGKFGMTPGDSGTVYEIRLHLQ